MIGAEVIVGGVVIYWFKRLYLPQNQRYCYKSQIDKDSPSPAAQIVKEKLITLAKNNTDEKKQSTGDEKEENGVVSTKKHHTYSQDEEEIFGSGVWGVDFHCMKYADEPVLSVALYEETIKPRTFFPIVHPYMLIETPSWVYVLEKWRDGVAVSRFKRKDDAVRSRGKWFGPGRLSQRKMPHLLQSTNNVSMSTTELLVWAMEHPNFKQYNDNCHTFAANLSKKVGMKNPNTFVEDLVYENY